MKKIFDERGFMFLQVIFLTLIVSFAGMIILNGLKKSENQNATLRMIALNLAEEQFAELENLAADGNLSAGSFSFLGAQEDLKNDFDYAQKDKQSAVNFEVKSSVENNSGNLFNATVKVEWNFNNKNYFVELKKTIRKKYEQTEE